MQTAVIVKGLGNVCSVVNELVGLYWLTQAVSLAPGLNVEKAVDLFVKMKQLKMRRHSCLEFLFSVIPYRCPSLSKSNIVWWNCYYKCTQWYTIIRWAGTTLSCKLCVCVCMCVCSYAEKVEWVVVFRVRDDGWFISDPESYTRWFRCGFEKWKLAT